MRRAIGLGWVKRPNRRRTSESSLESIAERMLARTTVGHRKRRRRQSATPPAAPATASPSFTTASTVWRVGAPPPPFPPRIPAPSQRPSHEIPVGVTLSSTDCAAWYDEQWEAEEDEATQAYFEMQRQVRSALEEEKRREVEPETVDEFSVDDGLRAALPQSFGRAQTNRPALDAELAEEPTEPEPTTALSREPASGELDYGPPENDTRPARTPLGSHVLDRFRSIRASLLGAS